MNKYSNIFVYKRLCQQLEKTHAAWEKLEFIVLESSGIQENTQFEKIQITLSMLLELGLTVRETYASQLPKDLKDIIRIIVFFGPCLDFSLYGHFTFCFDIPTNSSLAFFVCFKYQAHWTMYCAMSFRWHNFQSIVHTFKTINYDKVVRSVMNEILVIYCNCSI